MSGRAVMAQARMELRLALRRGESLVVSFLIPVGVLVFFTKIDVLTSVKEPIDFLVPGVLALAVMSTAMVSLGIGTGFERRYGVLKRLGATPLSRGGLLLAKTLVIVALEALQAVVILVTGLALGWSWPGSLVVTLPLLLLGTPGWLVRYVLRPPSLAFRIIRTLCRFLPALMIFNVVLVFTHWPLIVNISLHSGINHFLLHTLLFISALIVWMPVVSPIPEIPRLAAPVRGAFLFLQSVVPTVPASFLTFGDTPLYKFYIGKPHLWGMTTLQDQQLAGLIMKIGGGTLLWALIAVVFFRWAADEDRRNQPQRGRREFDQERTRLHAPVGRLA